MTRWWIVPLLLCAVLAGCAGPRARLTEPTPTLSQENGEKDAWGRWDETGPYRIRSTAARYAANRFYDFMDMFDVSVSVGPWVRAEAQYLIGFWGFGATDCTRVRLGGRSWVLEEESTTVSTLPFPASLILFPSYQFAEEGDEVTPTIVTFGGISYENEYAKYPDPVWAGIPTSRDRIKLACVERDPKEHAWRLTGDSMAVGADAHLLVGGRVRVMPLQVFDFVAGIFGWNLVGDDIQPYHPD
jgi:hypothetical protein